MPPELVLAISCTSSRRRNWNKPSRRTVPGRIAATSAGPWSDWGVVNCLAGALSSRRSPQILRATLRLLVTILERSIKRKAGCRETTCMAPGRDGLRWERNGWSIQPPASAMQYGRLPIRRVMDGKASGSWEDMLSKRPDLVEILQTSLLSTG